MENASSKGAKKAGLTVYSYGADGKKEIITRYDNFYLHELPDISNRYYYVTASRAGLSSSSSFSGSSGKNAASVLLDKAKSVDFEIISPTKKRVQIKGATTPFYLAVSESYHDQWQLELDNAKVSGKLNSWIPWIHPDAVPTSQHFKLDNFLNGWYYELIKRRKQVTHPR